LEKIYWKKINPLLFVKAKLSYLHNLCTQALSYRINNKAPQEITLIERLNLGVFLKVNMANHTLHGCHMLFVIKYTRNCHVCLALHPRVGLPNGSCTRVPEGGDRGADGDMHYITSVLTLPAKASPGSFTLFLILCNYRCYDCAFMFQWLI
jgi:hypothetical protein